MAAAVMSSAAPNLAESLRYYTVDVFDKHGDPRVAHYMWMRTPWQTLGATLAYYIFVRHIGPAIMRNRKPYELLPLIRIYNLVMTLWNAFGFVTAIQLTNYGLDTLGCSRVDPRERDERKLAQIFYGWMFFTSRLVEFADTIFFVLRKKESQLTSFHVFHHSVVPPLTWAFLKFAPGGNSGIFPLINTVVHTIMYSYYLLATFPSIRPFLGWKKYLTQMQIVQFLIIIAVCMQPIFIPGCAFPRVLLIVMVAFSIVFICLFVDFYLKNYNQKKIAKHASNKGKASTSSSATKLTDDKHSDTNNVSKAKKLD